MGTDATITAPPPQAGQVRREVGAFARGADPSLVHGLDPGQRAGGEIEPGRGVGLDHRGWGAAGVADSGHGLHGGVRRHPHLDGTAGCPLGEHGQEVPGEQPDVSGLATSQGGLDVGGVGAADGHTVSLGRRDAAGGGWDPVPQVSSSARLRPRVGVGSTTAKWSPPT